MPFQIVHNDITKMNTDIIVNAANSALQPGGGVCGAIFRVAGIQLLAAECETKAPCSTGSAVITGAYDMPVKYIIHAVGPVWRGGTHHERELLAGAYRSALELAREYQCQSIAFPLISAGIYGYPKDQALAVAISTISEFLLQYEMDVYLVVFDRSAVQLSEQLFADVQHYVDTYYVPEPRRRWEQESQWLSEEEQAVWEPQNVFSAPKAEDKPVIKKVKPATKTGRKGGFHPQTMPGPASLGAVPGRVTPKGMDPKEMTLRNSALKSQRSL
ncbi:MAG: macro domain-containing protein, partial [Lachnospiraceae bacterium]|nr:macro domain-containing protein [Lachnospiraceae bacterium]